MISHVRQMWSTIGLGLLVAATSACDDTTGPERVSITDLPGSYEASVFTVTEDDVTSDLLLDGAMITVEIEADGTTTGRYFVPEGDESGADIDVSIEGTWTYDEPAQRLEFAHAGDTALRDMLFLVRRSEDDSAIELEGDANFSGQIVVIALREQEGAASG